MGTDIRIIVKIPNAPLYIDNNIRILYNSYIQYIYTIINVYS
jgi:hypothetical protein